MAIGGVFLTPQQHNLLKPEFQQCLSRLLYQRDSEGEGKVTGVKRIELLNTAHVDAGKMTLRLLELLEPASDSQTEHDDAYTPMDSAVMAYLKS
jgi:hypothetical protein